MNKVRILCVIDCDLWVYFSFLDFQNIDSLARFIWLVDEFVLRILIKEESSY
jgi:hypothetical protein